MDFGGNINHLGCLLLFAAQRAGLGFGGDDAPAALPEGTESTCSAGSLDTTFGSSGVTTIFGLMQDRFAWFSGVKIDSASRIVASGFFMEV